MSVNPSLTAASKVSLPPSSACFYFSRSPLEAPLGCIAPLISFYPRFKIGWPAVAAQNTKLPVESISSTASKLTPFHSPSPSWPVKKAIVSLHMSKLLNDLRWIFCFLDSHTRPFPLRLLDSHLSAADPSVPIL